jgi:hypothetical protein
MKAAFFLITVFLTVTQIKGQELFVMTEPASNMPSGAVGVRTMNSFMFNETKNLNYHLMPEIMWGISQKWMVHLQSFHSNRSTPGLKMEGVSFYAKYRFYSNDDLHKHFRLAAYGRVSLNNADIHQEEIETMGHNTGGEFGFVATQLVHKLAISTSISYEKAFDNMPDNEFPSTQSDNATNYTLSFGRLMYPHVYKNFRQTNINLMVEFLGQTLNQNGKTNLDIVPSVQLIIRSRARIDLAYRKEVYSSMLRTAPSGFLIKFEYTFFNVTK